MGAWRASWHCLSSDWWARELRAIRCAMVKEGTPGKYALRAVEPGSRRPLVESYATSDQVVARRSGLERAGYTVIVTVGETVQDGSGHRSVSVDR